MCIKMKEYSIDEILISRNQGINTTTEKVVYSSCGNKIVQAKNIHKYKCSFDDENYIDNITFERIKDIHKLSRGNVLFSNIGSQMGNACVFDSDEPAIITWNVLKMCPNTQIVDADYLCFWFNWKSQEIRALNSSSTMPFVSGKVIGSLTISLPCIETQNKISQIISMINRKIAINSEINQNLLQLLHAYYLETFAYSEMNTPLGDVVMTTSGGTPSRKHDEYYSDANICWVKSKELLGGYIQDTEEHINDIAIKSSSAKLLPAYSVLIAMYGATIGAYGIIASPMACNQAVCALLHNDSYPYTYLFQVASESQAKFVNLAVGSAQQNISQVLIKQLPIHGDLEAIRKFHSLALPIHEEINTLCAENIRLAQIRDVLLPKLMSGELDVSDIEL